MLTVTLTGTLTVTPAVTQARTEELVLTVTLTGTPDVTQTRIDELGLRRREEEFFQDGRGWIERWPLQLESFASVRR